MRRSKLHFPTFKHHPRSAFIFVSTAGCKGPRGRSRKRSRLLTGVGCAFCEGLFVHEQLCECLEAAASSAAGCGVEGNGEPSLHIWRRRQRAGSLDRSVQRGCTRLQVPTHNHQCPGPGLHQEAAVISSHVQASSGEQRCLITIRPLLAWCNDEQLYLSPHWGQYSETFSTWCSVDSSWWTSQPPHPILDIKGHVRLIHLPQPDPASGYCEENRPRCQ